MALLLRSTLVRTFLPMVFLLSEITVAQSSLFAYNGGIPLRTPDDCPSGTIPGQVTFEQNCCGTDQTFFKSTNGSFCCPDTNDCSQTVIDGPKCANTTWEFCGSDSDVGFCCEEDWICYEQLPSPGDGGGVGCSSPGATLGVSQTEVLTIFAANAGPGVTSSSSTATSNAEITTTSSSPGVSVATGGISSAGVVSGIPSKTQLSLKTTSSSSSITSSTVASSTRPSTGIAKGAQVGIGIAVPIIIIAAISVGFLMWRRHEQNKAMISHTSPLASEDGLYRRHEMPVQGHEVSIRPELPHTSRPSEMEDTGRSELQ